MTETGPLQPYRLEDPTHLKTRIESILFKRAMQNQLVGYSWATTLEIFEVIKEEVLSKNNDYADPNRMVPRETNRTKSAAERLEGLAELRRQRQQVYGDHFMHKGKILKALFPEGLKLETEADFTRAANLFQTIDKMARYSVNFSKGGHEDSLDDLAVYAQIQAYIDEVAK